MVYAADHPDLKLQGEPKGMKAVLQEQESVWDKLMSRCKGKVVRKCKECSKLQAKKDAEAGCRGGGNETGRFVGRG
jgi:hypothetical protein